MGEEKSIVKEAPINAASFITKRYESVGVNLITALITERVKSGNPIETDDIIELYYMYKSRGGRSVMVDKWVSGEGWKWIKADYDSFKAHWKTKPYSLAWFKSNLGNAILRGKLLVIPVINIE